jgi:hypothetical protein
MNPFKFIILVLLLFSVSAHAHVFINTKLIHNGNADWSYFGRNYIASGDPGFENYKEMNFQLKSSSEIFKLLPGFKAVPFNKIGIQKKK